MSELWKLFNALGDPHRLELVNRLAGKGPLPMARLMDGMPFTRQGGAKHLAVLSSAGLITLTRKGREKLVSLERDQFHLAQMFMKQMNQEWDDRLLALKESLESEKP